MPERIQMSRSRPWRAEHPDAVIVDRRTEWGNPYRVQRKVDYFMGAHDVWVVRPEPLVILHRHRYSREKDALARALHLYRQYVIGRVEHGSLDLSELAGKDLACWCPLDDGHGNRVPCHADVLLAIANEVA